MARDAKPGGWKSIVIGMIVGVLVLGAIVGATVAVVVALGGETKEVTVSYDAVRAGQASPEVSIDGTEVTLLEIEDPFLGDRFQPGFG